jgi:hypothetical protein
MFDRLKNLFAGKKNDNGEAEQKAAEEWYEDKTKLMEEILGPEHDMVMHAIIPYAVGGTLDLYYFGNGVPGTAIATKELSESANEGSSNEQFSCYELVMFTRHPLNLDQAKDKETAFGRAHSNINLILNHIAPYSAQATLNARETCEFPADMEGVGGKCLIFDAYGSELDANVRKFGLLLIMEIFASEMEFARQKGGAELIGKLKAARHYPYSDLDRAAVA